MSLTCSTGSNLGALVCAITPQRKHNIPGAGSHRNRKYEYGLPPLRPAASHRHDPTLAPSGCRLRDLRDLMANPVGAYRPLDAYIVPMDDEHQVRTAGLIYAINLNMGIF